MNTTPKRLWDKDDSLNKTIHKFTVGSDPDVDLVFARWDVIASAAQAKVLKANGILNEIELKSLLASLKSLLDEIDSRNFTIPSELEDCHTTIEVKLTEQLGDLGKKIHTGRSRNDQVLVAFRLFLKEQLIAGIKQCLACTDSLKKIYEQYEAIPLPGYTHFQRAMPSSIGMWILSYMEAFAEGINAGFATLELIDANPLGVGSGFGVPLDMQRELSTKLLGFARTQRNSINVQNSRGKYEIKVLRWMSDVAGIMQKFACDLMLYTTEEFGFFKLPTELTTGSSIMPQKRNPDVVELLRAHPAKINAALHELEEVTAKLPSSYHRDFQYTKEPCVRGIKEFFAGINVFPILVESLEPCVDKLKSISQAPELFATYEAYAQVQDGLPFRDAYKIAAEKYASGKLDLEKLKQSFEIIRRTYQAEEKILSSELVIAKKKLDTLEKDFFGKIDQIFN